MDFINISESKVVRKDRIISMEIIKPSNPIGYMILFTIETTSENIKMTSDAFKTRDEAEVYMLEIRTKLKEIK